MPFPSPSSFTRSARNYVAALAAQLRGNDLAHKARCNTTKQTSLLWIFPRFLKNFLRRGVTADYSFVPTRAMIFRLPALWHPAPGLRLSRPPSRRSTSPNTAYPRTCNRYKLQVGIFSWASVSLAQSMGSNRCFVWSEVRSLESNASSPVSSPRLIISMVAMDWNKECQSCGALFHYRRHTFCSLP